MSNQKIKMMQEKKLFSDFAPVTKAQWKEKIISDLKGADFDKKLVWHTDAGFDIQPVYTREDMQGLQHLDAIPLKSVQHNEWKINELFFVSDLQKTHQMVLQVLENGAGSLAFVFQSQPDLSQLKSLLENVNAEKTALNFKVPDPVDLLNQLSRLADEYGWNKDNMQGSVHCDPLAAKTVDFSTVKTLFEAAKAFPRFHCLTLDVSGFLNQGGTTVTELGLALSYGVETIQQLGDQGLETDQIAARLRFHFAVGARYFFEMAKFRAFRYLWSLVLKAYGIQDVPVYIHASNAMLNKTVYDPYVNMLRTTTESMSAVLGGVDAFTVMPFDATFEVPTQRAIRVARNQQNILKEESFFNKVADPAAGSYYIENLTDQLINESWKQFLEIDEQGGYLAAKEQGFVDERLHQEAQHKIQQVKQRKQSVLGVNIFPNQTEKSELDLPENYFTDLFRVSADLEKLRYQTDVYARTNKRPVVWLFTYGDLTMRRARAQFASGFFGCAGYEIIDHPGFESIEAGIQQAKKDKPDIVVLCASDEDYKSMAVAAFKALKDDMTVVMAGYPADQLESLKMAGWEHFIHVRSNLMDELNKYQQVLGI
jgi:methylmalonyl-CoA mutase